MNKSQLREGLVVKRIYTPQTTITLQKQSSTKWLCQYENGYRRWWSQSHILKYYMLP